MEREKKEEENEIKKNNHAINILIVNVSWGDIASTSFLREPRETIYTFVLRARTHYNRRIDGLLLLFFTLIKYI